MLLTAEKGWAESVWSGNLTKDAFGHGFRESYVDGCWILIDPTSVKAQKYYDCSNIYLTGHDLGGKKDFISYMRGLDIGHRQNVQEFVTNMVAGIENQAEAQKE